MPFPTSGSEISFGKVYRSVSGRPINEAGDADAYNVTPKTGSQNIKLSNILGGYNYTAGSPAPIAPGTQISFSLTLGGDPDDAGVGRLPYGT